MRKSRKTWHNSRIRTTSSFINPEDPDLFSFDQGNFYQSNHSKEEFLKQNPTKNMDVSVKLISTLLKTKNTSMNSINTFTNTYSILEVAKMLNFPYGRTTLYRLLREKEIINLQNIPYPEYRNLGYFKLHEKFRQGNAIQSDTVLLVTNSGLDFIKRLLDSDLNPNVILNPESL